MTLALVFLTYRLWNETRLAGLPRIVASLDSVEPRHNELRLTNADAGSALNVDGIDVLEVYEQFFRSSEQAPARFLEIDATRFGMVMGLPESDPHWIAGLDAGALAGLHAEAAPLDEREFHLQCGCSPDRVAGTLARMFAKQADEFFAGQPVVEALCPRCGARHLLDRRTFDRLVDEL